MGQGKRPIRLVYLVACAESTGVGMVASFDTAVDRVKNQGFVVTVSVKRATASSAYGLWQLYLPS